MQVPHRDGEDLSVILGQSGQLGVGACEPSTAVNEVPLREGREGGRGKEE